MVLVLVMHHRCTDLRSDSSCFVCGLILVLLKFSIGAKSMFRQIRGFGDRLNQFWFKSTCELNCRRVSFSILSVFLVSPLVLFLARVRSRYSRIYFNCSFSIVFRGCATKFSSLCSPVEEPVVAPAVLRATTSTHVIMEPRAVCFISARRPHARRATRKHGVPNRSTERCPSSCGL